jgi:hypothetical protein
MNKRRTVKAGRWKKEAAHVMSRDVSDVTAMRAVPTAVEAAASSWLLLPS